MVTIFLLCCFLAITFSDGAATAESGVDAIAVTDSLHKISKRHTRNTELVARQDDSACSHLLQLPSYCNLTMLSGGISDLNASSLNDAQLAALNRAYSQLCVPACIDPIETYYNCVQTTDSLRNYLITLIRKGVCGQESGDYCEVRYIRQYNGNINGAADLTRSCTFSSSGISCSGASSTCLSHVGTFSSRMGCCTEPYLGSGVRSCSGISVDAACTGLVSSAAVLAAPVFMMVFALIGFLA